MRRVLRHCGTAAPLVRRGARRGSRLESVRSGCIEWQKERVSPFLDILFVSCGLCLAGSLLISLQIGVDSS